MRQKESINNLSKIDTSIYKCIFCNARCLKEKKGLYQCNKCGAEYYIMFGVPLFLKGLNIVSSDYKLTLESVRQICDFTGLSKKRKALETLQDIFTYNYHFNDLSLDAENNYFFNRVPLPEDMKRLALKKSQDQYPINSNIEFSFISHFIPAIMVCRQSLTRNIRLINRGNSIISSKGSNPVTISYSWYGSEGEQKDVNQRKTPLPIDLHPKRAITMPVLVDTPHELGLYRLKVFLKTVDNRVLDGNTINVDVQIIEGEGKGLPAFWRETKKPQETYDYNEDHKDGQKLVFQKLSKRKKSFFKKNRILEVGGCCNPMVRGAEADIYNIDIDIQTLQVGQLSVREPKERLQFIAADVFELPFVEHSFDFIIMFSSLHHFARPDKALQYLTNFLKPDGTMAIMCEPVGNYTDGKVSKDFVEQLEQGINEQIFTAEEYHEFFTGAGLYPEEVIIDRGSLKAILKTKPLAMRGSPSRDRSETTPISELPLDRYEATYEGFITLLYNRILSREPDQVGLAAWVSYLDYGTETGYGTVYKFIFGEECQAKTAACSHKEFINFLHRALFNREPEPSNLNTWLAGMADGMGKEELVARFTKSEEFINLCKSFGVAP